MTTPRPSESTAEVKFQLASDLHMHSNGAYNFDPPGYQYRLTPSADYLLLPGDIGAVGWKTQGQVGAPGTIDHREEYRQWLVRTCAHYKKVFLIPGNHEYRGDRIGTVDTRMMQWETDPAMNGKLRILTNESHDLLDDQGGVLVTMIGCVLWTHITADQHGYNNLDFHPAPTGITHDNIAHHNKRFSDNLAAIQRRVAEIRKESPTRRILVMTHHGPALRGCSRPEWDGRGYANAWTHYQSDVLGGIGVDGLKTGDFWVFGHTHWNVNFMQDEVRVIANQRGRVGENNRYSPNFTFTM